jgi:alkylhydroperoxidase/carboxymuconolactone decarboxylase family protein YurZ
MAWIRMIDETEADPATRLGRLYKACLEPEAGTVDEVLKIHGLRPETLDAHLRLYKTAMRPRDPGGLSLRERELIAVAVSAANGCAY